MNKHSIVNLKCPCFIFRYSILDIASQALFNLQRARALPLWCGSEDYQNFQSPPGHSRRPVRRRRYCMVLVCQCERLLKLGKNCRFSNTCQLFSFLAKLNFWKILLPQHSTCWILFDLDLHLVYFTVQNFPVTREWNEADWLDPLICNI